MNSYKRLPYKVNLNEELYTKQQYFGNYGKQLNQNIKKKIMESQFRDQT